MSTEYILRRLEKIESVKERRAEAVKLFNCFKNEIPIWGINPPLCMDDPDVEDIIESGKWAEDFFGKIGALCGGELPSGILSFYREFKKNHSRTHELLKLSRDEQRGLKTHERFPYWSDFNGAVHKLFGDNCWGDLDLTNLTFLPNFIVEGGFASIYRVEDKDKNNYALKLFHPFEIFPIGLGNRRVRKNSCIQIAKNLEENVKLVSKEPFARLRKFPFTCGEPLQCYLMDFVSGINVDDLLESKAEIPQETAGRVLLTYAQMLESLHKQNKLFVDNNWGSVIVNGEEVRICDYDLLTSCENVASDEFHTFQARYGSRENYVYEGLRKSSDLEQFALMMDHLLSREPLLGWETMDRINNREIAEKNVRVYPRDKLTYLPSKLKQIIPALISYPRDDSISAKDFVTAIKEDYGL